MGNLEPTEIRKMIETELAHALKNSEKRKIVLERRDAYGHEAGIPIEEWVKRCLEEIDWGIGVYFPNEFLEKFFSEIGGDENKILRILEKTWWGSKFKGGRLLVTPRQIDDFVSGSPVGRWQQEAGDVVLFYGNDLLKEANDIILLNAKSHNEKRKSRPPNIMSAERLLKFFHALLNKPNAHEMLEKINIWFVGAGYIKEKPETKIVNACIRDLFLLDLSKLPQINFDAAIQIQWHVKDMAEIKEQDKLTFIGELVATFEKQWQGHVRGKREKYRKVTGGIKELVKKLRGS
jgi:hypothetical protein